MFGRSVVCVFAAVVCLVVLARPAEAAEFYVDPVNGSDSGDGSAQRPWKSLQNVWDSGFVETRGWDELPYDDTRQLVAKNDGAPVGPGDTIWLLDGYHGALEITGAYNAEPVTVAAAPGHTPRFSSVRLRAVSNWVLRGLSVSPSHAPTYEPGTMIDIDSHGWQGPSSQVTVEGCTLFSVEDTSGWSAQDWVDNAANGINADGDDVTIRDNRLDNVRFGISASGERAHVERNEIVNFSGDGLRGLGDDSVFEYNLVKNCYNVDDNHDDGFQSWSSGEGGVGTGEVRGMVLRGNTIINYDDPDQPFRGPLQGIGCFDGMFVDWVVENNVIIVDHWHGISLLGAEQSRIVNNTVIDINTERPGPPWIRVAPHKNGQVSEDVIVRNNLATAFSIDEGQTNVVEDHNITVDDLSAFFVDPEGHDLHLLESAAAVDSGSADGAPAIDVDGVPRPQGSGFDLGAYEYHEGEIEPADAGGDASSQDAGGGSDVTGADATDAARRDASTSGEDGCSCRTGPAGPAAPWGLGAICVLIAWAIRKRVSPLR